MELSIQTDKVTGEIVSIAYPVMEAMKSTGQSFENMREAFSELENHGLIEKRNHLVYNMTDKGRDINSLDELNDVFEEII